MQDASIFIGGASQSGKSTLALMLAEVIPLPLYNMDHDPIVRALRKSRWIRHPRKIIQLYCVIRLAVRRGPMIMDCPSISPKAVASRFLRLDPTLVYFLGYPHADLDGKIAQLSGQNFRGAGHLSGLPMEKLKLAITRYQRVSAIQQTDCEALNFTFLDFSDLENLTIRQNDAVALIESRSRARGH